MSAVFKTKLRPRFVGPFTVTAKKGLAYALNIPRKLCTHPVFYVDLLKPYRDPSHVNLEALAPTTRAVPRIVVSEPASPTESRSEFEQAPSPEGDFSSHPACTRSYPRCLGDPSLREPVSRGPPTVHRPPPTLLDEHENLHFRVERILKRRRRHGQYQYLVKWRG